MSLEENKAIVLKFYEIFDRQGELMGIPPTGKQVSFSVIHIDHVVDGKIVEHWG